MCCWWAAVGAVDLDPVAVAVARVGCVLLLALALLATSR
jgi:hypothetical protein